MTEAADTTTTLLETNGLAVRRHGEALLDGVTLRVRRGSVHVIVGPNGAGKTTLLSAILNQIPFDGEIAMNWIGSGAVGYVPQAFAVDPTLPVTVADFLALTRQRRPVCLGLTGRARAEVARLLALVGLAGLEERPLAVLSGGELRRVLLAHALDPEPELLLLDEPTAGFDESAARIFESILIGAKRAAHTTVVMVSHDLELVRRVADRVTVLNRQIVAEGAPDILSTADVRELLPVRKTALGPIGPAKAGHHVRSGGA
jgi:zinc transport system ATP-binding protein